jgi:hypothetical protein
MHDDVSSHSDVALNADATIGAADNVINRLAVDLEKTALNNFATPVHRLPPELLSQIFLGCLPAQPKPRDTNAAPLLLAQICSHWREIALSTAFLWRHIHICVNTSSPESQISWVNSWLVRSAGCPLSVLLHCHGTSTDHPVFSAITRHASRWEDLDIQLPYSSIPALIPAKRNFPILRRLRIEIIDLSNGRTPLDIFLVTPKLRDVYLRLPLEQVELPWAQLTHGTLTLEGNDCIDFIRRTPQLVDCTLEDCMDIPDMCQTPDQRATSQLVALHLTESMPSSILLIFDHITLPALHELSIDLVDSTDWPHSTFMDFMARSSCHLQRLALLSVNMSHKDFIILLQNQPSLIELEIDWVDTPHDEGHSPIADDNLIQRLNYLNNSTEYQRPNILPMLRILKLWGPLPFNDNIFVSMVRSRWQCSHTDAAQLTFVGAQYHRALDVQAMRQLQDFCNEGLELLVEYVPLERRSICPQWGSEAPLPHNFPEVKNSFFEVHSVHTDHLLLAQ